MSDLATLNDGYRSWHLLLAFVVCAASFAAILHASWLDAAVGGLGAVASYGVSVWASRSSAVAGLAEFIAAAVATTLGSLCAALLPGVNPVAVAICACIWFVPGFGFTIAPMELVAGNTLSGMMWLTNALVTAFKLFGGFVFGIAVMSSFGWTVAAVAAPSIPSAWGWAAAPLLVIGLAALMRTDLRHMTPIALGAWLVWGALQLGNAAGHWQGTFLAASVLVVYGRWFEDRRRVPSTVILLPCVMILVPGLAALRALDIVDREGIVEGFRAASDVLTLVAAIIGGSVVGDAIVSLALSRRHREGRSVRNNSSQ